MSNEFYNPTGWPASNAPGSSAPARQELNSIQSGFAKLPTMTGNGNLPVFVNAGGTAITTVTAAAARTLLGLVIGTNVQAYDAGLQSIAGLTTAADKMIYTTASDVYATTDLTAFARTLLDDTDAATMRTTLGLGSAATVTLGTNVATALAVNVGSAGAIVVNGGALGTPSSATLTNATGLPLTTGVTGTLPIANGGTGLTSYTANGVIYANGSGALTSGSGLQYNGTVFTVAPTGSTLNSPDTGTGSLAVYGPTSGPTNRTGALRLECYDALGSDVGTGIAFSARFQTASNASYSFAKIGGYKENALTGDGRGYFTISTTDQPGNLIERVRVDSSGYFRMTSGSGGIQFNGDTAAANALDDYEQGTWTPFVGGNASYTTQIGHYTKVGRLVTVSFTLKINVLGTGSTANILGLPFNTNASIPASSGALYFDGPIASSIVNLVGITTGTGNDVIQLYASTAATNALPGGTAIFGDGARVSGTFTYQV